MLKRFLNAVRTRPQKVSPVEACHVERSLLFSADDAPGGPSTALLDIALQVAQRARTIDLKAVSDRIPAGQIRYPDIWPGEHYRLLAAVVVCLRPRTVIETGTAEGLSALTMTELLPPRGRVTTFDLIPLNKYPETRLTAADFADGRLVQHIDDLSNPAVFTRHAELLRTAEVVFLDAAKDGRLEQVLLDHFSGLRFEKPPLFILDDIRLWNMLAIWRGIESPKLVLTSFGHWSGTGFVEWA